MTHECTLKEAFIIKALDEIQPDWRTGADVRRETKDKIRERVAKKYADIFDPDNSACITVRSIEKTVNRIREKLDIHTSRERFQLPDSVNYPIRDNLDSPAPKPAPSSDIQATAEPGEPAEPNEPGEPSIDSDSGKGLESGQEQQQLEMLDALVELGDFPSVSEAIRAGVRDLVDKRGGKFAGRNSHPTLKEG